MIFLIINWWHIVYSLVDPGFLSPLNFYEALRFVPPMGWMPLTDTTDKGTKRRAPTRFLKVGRRPIAILANLCVRNGRAFITARTLLPSSVNGDIAIQWEWSNFDPSQNPHPLTDYDKTLHNWLCTRDEHVTQNLCQSAVKENLAKYVEYKDSYFYFFPGLAYWSNPCMDFDAK